MAEAGRRLNATHRKDDRSKGDPPPVGSDLADPSRLGVWRHARLAIVLVALVVGAYALRAFVHVPSLLLVVGGTVAAAWAASPMGGIDEVRKVLRDALCPSTGAGHDVIVELVQCAATARRAGVLALERRANESRNPLLKTGLQMLADGAPPTMMESVLKAEMNRLERQRDRGRAFFENVGRFSPAFGMIGTVIGLVLMLRNMNEPSGIGPAMAVALLTTLYGLGLSHLIAHPLAERIRRRGEDESELYDAVCRGMLAIQQGENPRVVEQLLNAHLPPRLRSTDSWIRRAA